MSSFGFKFGWVDLVWTLKEYQAFICYIICIWYIYVYVYGICIWYMYMVYVYGICIWYMYMVYVYGICIWYMYMVYVYGNERRWDPRPKAGPTGPRLVTIYIYHIHIPYTYAIYIYIYTYTIYICHIHIPYTYTLYIYPIHIPYTYTMYYITNCPTMMKFICFILQCHFPIRLESQSLEINSKMTKYVI